MSDNNTNSPDKWRKLLEFPIHLKNVLELAQLRLQRERGLEKVTMATTMLYLINLGLQVANDRWEAQDEYDS